MSVTQGYTPSSQEVCRDFNVDLSVILRIEGLTTEKLTHISPLETSCVCSAESGNIFHVSLSSDLTSFDLERWNPIEVGWEFLGRVGRVQ